MVVQRGWSGRSERVELMPSAARIGELSKGPMDRLEGYSSWESKEVVSAHKGN
jgi:hypothetical protein